MNTFNNLLLSFGLVLSGAGYADTPRLAEVTAESTIIRAGGGMDGGGGDTYVTEFDEARKIAKDAIEKLAELKSSPSSRLAETYKEYRDAWITALRNPKLDRSEVELFDTKGDGRSKAALADSSAGTISISVPYFDSHSISLIQLVVLAIHESGHLAKVPLSHSELDEVGMTVARDKLVDFFGSSGLRKLTQANPSMSIYEKLKLVYQDAPTPASFDDFSPFKKDPDSTYIVGDGTRYKHVGIWPQDKTCILVKESWEVFPIAFMKEEMEKPNYGPLFSDGSKTTQVLNVTLRKNGSMLIQNPKIFSAERKERDFVIQSIYDLGTDSDYYHSDYEKKLVFLFRKSQDLVVFEMYIDGINNYSYYGYCWKP